MDSFFYLVIFAGAIAGAGTSLLGVYVVGMRMPFIGICISHAAMAGVVFSYLLGFNQTLAAIAVSIAVSMSLALIRPSKSSLNTNLGLAIAFSFVLGLTFLGIGLIKENRADILSTLWGNILFVDSKTTIIITILSILLGIFLFAFNKEMKVLMFSRTIAAATGVHERFIYSLFLVICGIIISVNLKLIGGLMIFSLLSNPAASAYQICRGHKAVIIVSVLFGILSAIGGFFVSYLWNLPTGACIVITSTIIFAVSTICKNLINKS